MTLSKKYRSILIIIGLLLCLSFFGYQKFKPQPAQVTYQTAQAELGTLIKSVSASGTITSGNGMNITTQASGIVSNVYVKNGDVVTKGQKIAELTLDQDAAQKYAAANASYQSAANSYQQAQNNKAAADATLWKDRQTVLDAQQTQDNKNAGQNNSATHQDYTLIEQMSIDSALIQAKKQFDVDQQKLYDTDLAIHAAQAQLGSAGLAVGQVAPIITAPMNGIVSNLTLTPGLTISSVSQSSSNSSASQVFGSIRLENNAIQATVSISEIDVVGVQIGQKVSITIDALPNKTFTGKVIAINTNGVVSSGVTSYPATLALDSAPAMLYPNMAVNAKIITTVKDNVIMVPTTALQTTNGQTTVRLMKNGVPTPVVVEIGDANDTQTAITSGISEGDVVVTGTSGGTTRITTQTGTSPFSALSGNRGFGVGGGTVIRTGGGTGGR